MGAMILVAVGCQSSDGGVSTPTIPPLAFVRYINAVPDSVSMDSIFVRVNPVTTLPETTFYSNTHTTTVRWVDQVEYTPQTFVNVAFRGLGQGGYQGLEAGSRHLRIFTYDPRFYTTSQLVDTTFTYAVGQYYTIMHVRTAAGTHSVNIYTDTLPATSTQVQYRAVNAARGLGAVDLYATATTASPIAGAPAAANIAEFGRSAFISAAPSAFGAAQITGAGLTVSLAAAAAPAGVAGTPTADPISGATVGGSVLSAYAFPASPAVVFYGRTFRAAITPAITWFADRQPPRTTAP